ncbi:hypothetical protein BRC72_07795 [Halobacteriales archaeon QH_7_66_36]|nr:MAG: hypothetical protein BRC72_07795 [Halobacteriales archaeon QH_7_66_36]
MGYACPVCDDPQADARHLANHLAFTAILGDDAHEAWLDDHAPGWANEGESELTARIADEAEQREYPQVFEDTTGGTREGDRAGELFESEGHGHGREHSPSARATDEVPYQQAEVTPDDETEAILDEARAMTREMLGEDEDGEADAEDADDAATSDG